MSRYVDLGLYAESSKTFRGDLDIILRSNVLVQANSGGGKSWLLRRFIEQAFKRVPQIVIDPEGEFSTLRSHFDVVLVGKGGDTPADIRSARLLAHRLLELGTSAVIDLYEMSKPQRPVWVAAFLNALIDAPKKLWRDFLIYIDEAHEFAPEPGHGTESRDEKVCRHALIDLAAKGRKRGYGVVAATQRLGKLSKDFAAELKNVLIGQTFIDIDRERAAGNLGVAKGNKPEFFKSVMKLEPGAFFAFGRAFVLEPTLVTIGDVETEHPEAGRRQSAPPPPTAKIRHLLPQLADLPKEAEDKIQTEKELRARIGELERELKKDPLAGDPSKWRTKTIEHEILSPKSIARLEKLVDKLTNGQMKIADAVDALALQRDRLAQAQQAVVSEIGSLKTVLGKAKEPNSPRTVVSTDGITRVTAQRPRQIRAVDRGDGHRSTFSDPMEARYRGNDDAPSDLSRCARALLRVLAVRGNASDSQISALSGYKKTSSSFANGLSELRTRGFIDGSPDNRVILPVGRDIAGPQEPLPTGAALVPYWLPRLTKSEATMLQVIYDHGTISREDLAREAEYSITSSSFANALSGLRTLDLIHGRPGGDVTIADVFKE